MLNTHLRPAIHEALQLQPVETFARPHNAAARLVAQFLDLLEQHFPVESPEQKLDVKTVQDMVEFI